MRIYNVVQSVKGGCGKTTFSIMLSSFLGLNKNREKMGETCLLDVDFQGTSLINLFTCDDKVDTREVRQCYLNDKMRKYDDCYSYVREYNGFDRKFYYVPSSPKQDQKEWFSANAKMNYIPHMAYNMFEINLKSMLDSNGEGIAKEIEKLTNIIFDMPPSCDAYSDIIKKCVVNESERIRKSEDIVNYFLMINLDPTHLYSTIEYLEQILRGSDQIPTHIFIVFNNTFYFQNDSKVEQTLNLIFEERKKDIEIALEKEHIDEKTREKIIFLTCPLYKKYVERIVNKETLCKIKGDNPFTDNPVKYMGKCGSNTMHIINSDEFIELISTTQR